MIDWTTCPAVECKPDYLSSAWTFRGTRVPVAALFENLEDGVTIDQFGELFPGVTLHQLRVVLEHAAKSQAQPHKCTFCSMRAHRHHCGIC